MHSLRAYVPALILLAGCALIADIRAQRSVPLVAPLNTILPAIHGHTVTDLTMGAEERRVAGMSSYVARAYSRDGSVAFTTLVAYYDRQVQGRTIHSPRNCLPGAGWEIINGAARTIAVDGVPRDVNRYVLRNGSAAALVYYWYQGRGRVTANEYAVKWNLLRDAALIGRTEESLVRVVVPFPASDPARGEARADSIAQEVAATLMRHVRRVLPARGSSAS